MGCRASANKQTDDAEDTAKPEKSNGSESARKFLRKQLTVTDLERHGNDMMGDKEDVGHESRGSFEVKGAIEPSSGKRRVLKRSCSTLSSVSMSSEVDKKEKRHQGTEKAFEKIGEMNPEDHGIYVTCRRGQKVRSLPNQDAWSVLKTETHAVYGVYDGHGRKGHDVSNYVKQHLPRLLENDGRFGTAAMRELVLDAFSVMENLINTADEEKQIDATRSGTTATIVIHDIAEETLTVAHVGDSGASIARGENRTTYMTPDHTPEKAEEKARIEASGGTVTFDGHSHRVYKLGEHYPALNMSRAFGDIRGREAGVISVPDVSEVKLTVDDQYFMLCSDGVWEFITPEEATEMCNQALKAGQNPAKFLATEALKRWKEHAEGVVDDITVVFSNLKHKEKEKRPPVDESLFTVELDPQSPKPQKTIPLHRWRNEALVPLRSSV